MGDTIKDMDKKLEQKDNKIENLWKFIENKIGLPDCKFIEEMNKLGLIKISSKRKGDRIMDRLNNSLNNHKYFKKAMKLKFLGKSFALIMIYL